MNIAFNAADPFNTSQLKRLEQFKQPPSNLVVTDARRHPVDPNQLIVQLDAPLPGPTAHALAAGPPSPRDVAPEPPPGGLQKALRRSVWNQRTQKPAAVKTGPPRNTIRILCIHGIGHGDVDPDLVPTWEAVLTAQLQAANPVLQPHFHFLEYDDLFDQAPHNVLTYGEAFLRLGWSAVATGIGSLFAARGTVSDSLRWTAGMVAQWAENGDLRRRTRERIAEAVKEFEPDLVVAHSLGTLVSYDAFSRVREDNGKAWNGPGLIAGRFYVSMGSQIGSPFTRSTLGGRINPLNARHWFHLFNKHDNAFTAEIRLRAPNYDQLLTTFDIDGMLDHDAAEYLRHPLAYSGCWRNIALAEPPPLTRGKGRNAADLTADQETQSKLRASVLKPVVRQAPRRRALLVGINDYPDPASRLEGCVNDVFLMSSLLQENGFGAEDVRVILNERATAAAILERMQWLLEDAGDGMDRVFYYSGHGAQIPSYGTAGKVERDDECLVAYDFDWSREHAVTDDQFYDLYSQLPYETRFCAIFDCCHSGGLAREGGSKIRGLTPPDDIRHRALRWDEEEGMWVRRELGSSDESKALIRSRRKYSGIFGERGDKHRLFRAAALRPNDEDLDRACKVYAHKGPFLPVILQACGENEYSYEYRHGVISYGAFTFSLAQRVRELRKAEKKTSWNQLIRDLGVKLTRLRYDQTPCLICPGSVRNAPVPWGMKAAK